MPGLAHLASKVPEAVFVPVAFEYAFWDESRPQIFARFGSPVSASEQITKGAWNELLTGRLRQTQAELSQSVQERNPASFQYLIASRPVRLGWYDYCRSWVAWIQGKQFDPRLSV